MAAVFAGCTLVLIVAGFAYREPLVLIVAAPFALSTAFFWYQATGRLAARVRRQAVRDRQTRGTRASGRSTTVGGRGSRRAAGASLGGQQRRRTDAQHAWSRQSGSSPGGEGSPSESEARRILGVDAQADREAVRRAYRARVKETHPDAQSGSEAAFKRVQAAYDRLTE